MSNSAHEAWRRGPFRIQDDTRYVNTAIDHREILDRDYLGVAERDGIVSARRAPSLAGTPRHPAAAPDPDTPRQRRNPAALLALSERLRPTKIGEMFLCFGRELLECGRRWCGPKAEEATLPGQMTLPLGPADEGQDRPDYRPPAISGDDASIEHMPTEEEGRAMAQTTIGTHEPPRRPGRKSRAKAAADRIRLEHRLGLNPIATTAERRNAEIAAHLAAKRAAKGAKAKEVAA